MNGFLGLPGRRDQGDGARLQLPLGGEEIAPQGGFNGEVAATLPGESSRLEAVGRARSDRANDNQGRQEGEPASDRARPAASGRKRARGDGESFMALTPGSLSF